MASNTLYPPIIDPIIPAFPVEDGAGIGGQGELDVYFALSKYNSYSSDLTAQVIIKQKQTNLSVVNVAEDDTDNNIYRKSGIILNKPIEPTEQTGIFRIRLDHNDVQKTSYLFRNNSGSSIQGIGGWAIGEIYLIQIRLSEVRYTPPASGQNDQAAWLNANAQHFSEWSTVAITKAIGKVNIIIKTEDIVYNSKEEENVNLEENIKYLYNDMISLVGSYSCEDSTENLYSYRFKLLDGIGNLIEDSGVIYNNQYEYGTDFIYNFKKEAAQGPNTLEYELETNNKYIKTGKIELQVSKGGASALGIYIATLENPYIIDESSGQRYRMIFDDDNYTPDNSDTFINKNNRSYNHTHTDEQLDYNYYTTVELEEQEGRIAYRVCNLPTTSGIMDKNLIIRRSDDTTNYTIWEDIRLITLKQQLVNDLPLYYDYNIESGRSYKYTIQEITTSGIRRAMNTVKDSLPPTRRIFEHSYFMNPVEIVDASQSRNIDPIDYNYQQLKLCFNNVISSYQNTRQDAVKTTIGGKYPYITRNGNNNFRQFQMSGLISFNMDDVNLFLKPNFTNYYKEQYHQDMPVDHYDYTYEREFREKVIEFLNDGKPKLYKSKSEETMIVRITNVTFTPNQQLGRLIYDFQCTVYEIADFTVSNLLEYGLLWIKDYERNFETEHNGNVGQIIKDYYRVDNLKDHNIITDIFEQYDFRNMNLNGYCKKIKYISGIKFTFNSPPRKVTYKNNTIAGYKIYVNGTTILINGDTPVYYLDTNLQFQQGDIIAIIPDDDLEVNCEIDFVYSYLLDIYENKKVKAEKTLNTIGQYSNYFTNNKSLYKTIKFGYFIEHKDQARKLDSFSNIRIQSEPNVVFAISYKDAGSSATTYYLSQTGLWNLLDEELTAIADVKYLGVFDQNYNDGPIDNPHLNTNIGSSIIIDYIGKIKISEYAYVIEEGGN